MSDTGVVTLTEFLLARIAEDEALAVAAGVGDPDFGDWDDWPSYPWGTSEQEYALQHAYNPARVLAECEAKRQILSALRSPDQDDRDAMGWHDASYLARCALASVYADHPDFQEKWKP